MFHSHSLVRSLCLMLPLLAASCVPFPTFPGQFEAKVDSQLTPAEAMLPDLHGMPQPVAVSRDDNGIQSEFLEGVVILQPRDDADLQRFLRDFGGTIIDDNAIPEPPAELGITLTDAQRRPSEYVIRIDLRNAELFLMSANAAAIGLTGRMEFSTNAGMRTIARILAARVAGFSVVPNKLSHTQLAPGDFELMLNSQERLAGGAFQNAFADPHFSSGDAHSNTNVTLAWQFVAAHGIKRRVKVAIIDSGFWLDGAGRGRVDPALGNDSDLPAAPFVAQQYDFTDDDYIADGPSAMNCGGNPCFWHGNGSTSVATGILNNGLGFAGTGGQVAIPMLFKIDGSDSQRNKAISTAIAWGADVVSMSIGADCDKLCRIGEVALAPINGNINTIIDEAPGVVFVAAAGNGRPADSSNPPSATNPSVGYDVSVDTFYRPCTVGHVICVGAVNDSLSTIQSYSNYGDRVTIFAPTNIPVTAAPAGTDSNPAGPAGARQFGGTSASTPFIAGVAAMMKALNPDLTGDDVARIMTETSRAGSDVFVTRVIDAYAAVRRAAGESDNIPDRFEPNNGPGQTTNLGNTPTYSAPHLSISARDQDFFTFTSPGASTMTITLQYATGIGDIIVNNLQSLGETCGSPSLVSNVASATGRILTYNVPGGRIQLGLRATDFNAYDLGINFGTASLSPDDYESNDVLAAAKFQKSETGGLVIDPIVSIDASIHTGSDADYYIVRGARLSDPETALLFGGPFLSIYANTGKVNLKVWKRNDDGSLGDMVGAPLTAESCAVDVKKILQSDKYYFVEVTGDVGTYTLYNGVMADPGHLPPILVGGFPHEIIKPGPVEIERELRFEEFFLFIADHAYSDVKSIIPNMHLGLFTLSGGLLAEGTADGQGERLSVASLLANQPYAIKVTPTDVGAETSTLRLAWQPVASTRVSENLILNPGAESLVGPNPNQFIPYWDTVQSTPVTLAYGDQAWYPSAAGPGPVNRGAKFFAGGNDNSASAIRQTLVIDPAWRNAIDSGRVKLRFSAFLGGNGTQPDAATASLIFRRADDSVAGGVGLSPITPVERGNQTGLFPAEVIDAVPAGTTTVLVNVSFTGSNIGNFNDGYADNFELVLTEYPQ